MTRVLGVDGCRKGWIGIASDGRACFGRTIAELVETADRDGVVDVVAIDIPIGLPDASVRVADVRARAEIGRRSSSVFTTPVRTALGAAAYADANVESRRATGAGVSQQAYALAPKILQVDAWVRSGDRRVVEVHPEVSFATLAGRSLAHPKSTWAGFEERRALLDAAGLAPRGELGLAGQHGSPDDVLDAAVACWSALRVAAGTARSLPEEPERFSDGLAAAIWA